MTTQLLLGNNCHNILIWRTEGNDKLLSLTFTEVCLIVLQMQRNKQFKLFDCQFLLKTFFMYFSRNYPQK